MSDNENPEIPVKIIKVKYRDLFKRKMELKLITGINYKIIVIPEEFIYSL